MRHVRIDALFSSFALMTIGFAPIACAQNNTTEPALTTKSDASSAPDAGSDGAAQAPEAPTPRPDWLVALELGPAPAAKLREMVVAGDYSGALAQLNKSKPDAKIAPNLALLHGYVALEAQDYKRCGQVFSKLVASGEELVLGDYAAYWHAQCAVGAQDWNTAVTRAAAVPAESKLHSRSLLLMGTALQSAGKKNDLKRAVQVYDALLGTYSRGATVLDARVALAQLLVEQKKPKRAALVYNDIITHHPLSEQVPVAIKKLGELKPSLDAATKTKIAETSDEQRIRKLRALFGRHRSEDAVSNGARYLTLFEKKSDLYCETLFLVGKSYTKLREHKNSIPYYEKVTTECPDSKHAIKAYYQLGRGHWNSGNRKKAKASFKEVWTRYPKHSYADDAMLYVARILREEGSKKKMRAQLSAQVKAYPKGDMAKDAHWLIVRDLIARKKHKDIIKYVKSLDALDEHNLYSAGRLEYFKARAHEQLGQKGDAAETYQKVASDNPMGYYAMLSLNRLAALGGQALESNADLCSAKGDVCGFLADRQGVAETYPEIQIPRALQEDVILKRGAALLDIGLVDYAEDEFRQLGAKFKDDPSSLWAFAMLLDSVEAYPFSHNIPRRRIDDWKVDYPGELSRDYWHIAYPAPFEEKVSEWSKERDIPPYLVWAIMREESGFNVRIESWANARGLLQLIEGTAKTTAKKDGMDDFDFDQLFDAETNIRLGSAYMKELSDEFEAHPALIIAGYNAGAGNVNKWLDSRGDLPLDLWVEDIPFGQTRHYTKRVLTSFWTYRWLYDGQAVPALTYKMPEGS